MDINKLLYGFIIGCVLIVLGIFDMVYPNFNVSDILIILGFSIYIISLLLLTGILLVKSF